MKTLLNDFISLIYPRLCIHCGKMLVKGEEYLCIHCECDLPRTAFHNENDNPVSRIFWGRVNVVNATSYLSYHKESITQKIIHAIKYHGEKELGILMGKRFGIELNSCPINQVDFIIPIPLHKLRLERRGYNQSECIAKGIAEAMNKPCFSELIKRKVFTNTQTAKSRYDRWLNVEEVFEVSSPEKLINKHILLVDDVITTGATIESCVTALLKIEGCKISVATLAYASN